MIQANELRIGNWVNHSKASIIKKKYWGTPRQIDISDFEYLKLYEPIPLTHEILLACGFVKQDKRYSKDWFYLWDDNDKIIFALAEMSEQVGTYLKMNSLHQLQNLYFSLTGTELNYKP